MYPRLSLTLQPWAEISERLRRTEIIFPGLSLTLQPWAEISERLRRTEIIFPGLSLTLQPGLKLANAFGVLFFDNYKIMISTDFQDTRLNIQEATTLVQLLRWRALRQPEQVAYTFLSDDLSNKVTVSFGELDRQARSIASLLHQHQAGGTRVLLLYPPSLEYIAAFFGCLYAGAVAVPAYPPRQNHSWLRLNAIIGDAQADIALTSDGIYRRLISPANSPAPSFLRCITTESIDPELADEWQEPVLDSRSVAFLQYTSGSTGTPRGVMVSHGNLIANERLIQTAFRQTERSVILGWLPLYHDMGLIGNVLQPLYLGATCILMSPVGFLQKPYRWLKAISDYRATTSGGPNFAYDLCVRKITEEERATLDLSSWTTAFNGAEPVRPETLERFADVFASCGFDRRAFHPCYGLAEATLLVSCSSSTHPAVISKEGLKQNRVVPVDGTDDAQTIVSCGPISSEQQIVIVNPDDLTVCPTDRIGEIWVAGQSVAQGYWNQPEQTRETFQAQLPGYEQSFLRTGDLGFVSEGELFLTGRIKDLIIIRGRNHYPHDIEDTVRQCSGAWETDGCAAFSIDVNGEERLVVVQELTRKVDDYQTLTRAIRAAVAGKHEIPLYAIAFTGKRRLPKTSSGKIQRRTCRELFLEGTLPVVFEWRETASALDHIEPECQQPIGPMETWLVSELAMVLKIDAAEIDHHQPIVSYGLDSLLTIELAHRIESTLAVVISPEILLGEISVAQLAAQLETQAASASGLDQLCPRPAISNQHPLSKGQAGLWFLQQVNPESSAYNIAAAVRVRSDLDAVLLKRAFQALVNRHPALRTTFSTVDDKPCQWIHDSMEICFTEENTSEWDEFTLRQRLALETVRPFDLEHGPLFRVGLYKRADGEHVILLTIHHIIFDFWSLGVLLEELGELYLAETSGHVPSLAPLALEYTDFVHWQSDMLAGPEGERQWAYWQQQLSGQLPALNLSLDRPRPPVQTYRGLSFGWKIDSELTEKLRALCRENNTTLYTTLVAAFLTLLHRYTGDQDLMIGSPVSGRNRAQLARLIGYFVNPVLLRADLSGRPTFSSFLGQVRRRVLGAMAHQDYPFPMLVERLQPTRDPSRSPLYQASFVLQREHGHQEKNLSLLAVGEQGTRVKAGELEFENFELAERITPFDLTLIMAETDHEISAAFEYNQDLFDAATISRMSQHFINLVEGIVSNPNRPLADLPMIEDSERQQLLFMFNDTAAAYPAELTLQSLFEAQVARTPEAYTLAFGKERLTYEELNRRANQLAHYLKASGVGADSRVGICLDRSIEMVVGLLGILKAGAAYVPLDPSYPVERLLYMIDDAGLELLLTQGTSVQAHPIASLRLDEDWNEVAKHSDSNPNCGVTSDNLAYVMYTSGSTGRPKGVMISHRAICNHMLWMQETFRFSAGDRILQKTSFSFDASVWEFFAPLLSGAELVMAQPWEHHNADYLVKTVAHEKITILQLVPAMLSVFLQTPGVADCRDLRVVFCGGEVLPRSLQDAFNQHLSAELCNLYGPTEFSIDATYWNCIFDEPHQAVAIGRPISNTRAYVLDHEQQLVALGARGELHLGGVGLARGYLGRPELTAQRFVPDGVSGRVGERLYRTGDEVRYGVDGRLEYLGRLDQQVKVRGHRIELEEIEEVLNGHEGIEASVVVLRDQSLVGYVVTAEGAGLSQVDLRQYLSERLPAYMIPSVFVELPALPLTANGKVDRQALPTPAALELAGEYVGPRTAVEEILAEIWAYVLGLQSVGVTDNFFDLGGHSLLATQVISRVRDRLKVDLPLREFFDAPTVAAVSAKIEAGLLNNRGRHPLVPLTRDRVLPLSFAQERLWFLNQLEPESPAYNMAAVLRFNGALDIEALANSVSEIIRRHEILRTQFIAEQGHVRQVIHEPYQFRCSFVDLSTLPEAEQHFQIELLSASAARRPFHLDREPLLRLSVLRLAEKEHVLLFAMHHIVSDGWSLGILIRELKAIYEGITSGQPAGLEELPLQYADYAYWQREWLRGPVLDQELEYWRKQLADAPGVLDLPLDHPRGPQQSDAGATMPLKFSREALEEFSRERGVTLFVSLLAGFQLLLARYCKSEDVVVGSPTAGRTHTEVEDLIGFFVNTLVLRTDLSGSPNVTELVRRVEEVCVQALAHQQVPFERLVHELQPERDLSHQPLFQVMFAMQNTPLVEVQLNGGNLTLVKQDSGTAKFDLMVSLVEGDDEISGVIEYRRELFEEETIVRLAKHYEQLLQEMVAWPERRVSQLRMLSAGEERQIVTEWNETECEYPREVCIHELFAEQARRTPHAVAVIAEGEEVSYGELDRRANQVASRLQQLGVGPEVVVGICVERSVSMVVGLLGILKAGGAYLPLDAEYPRERLEYMIADAGVSVLLTQRELRERLPQQVSAHVVYLESDALSESSVDEPQSSLSSSNLAYLLYTSGSTGRPKAVAIEHRSAVALLSWAQTVFDEESLDGMLASTSINFDLSVFELFVPLSRGGKVIVAANALQLGELSRREEVRLLNTVPSAMRELVRSGQVPESVRVVNLAGEALSRSLVDEIYGLEQVQEVNNLYGPTEDTTYSTWERVARDEAGAVRIGKPIANTRAYVLDAEQQVVPVGVRGELYLGGAGLGRGYWGRPELTAERFVPDGVSGRSGERLYRTGDEVRYGADGRVEYVGRLDQQVKVRGYRIELGEVEEALQRHESIRESVVVVRDEQLVGYVVAAEGATVELSELRANLGEQLPGYMIPGVLVEMAALPLNANGKVDRKALPEPGQVESTGEYVGPRTAVEELLAGIWSEVLGVERVGVRDNFFELGGHSLLATQVISRVRESFKVELPLRSLFEAPRLGSFAGTVEHAMRDAAQVDALPLVPVSREQALPLSFAQQRLWFMQQWEPESATYHIPGAVRMKGALAVEDLEQTLQEIIERHESLRTVFPATAGEALQQVVERIEWSLIEFDLSDLIAEEQDREVSAIVRSQIQQGFDLTTGPLFRVVLVRVATDEHVLLLVLHHIIADGWSMGVLLRELVSLYESRRRGERSQLPELRVQYVDYAQWQREWLSGDVLAEQLRYWKEQLADAPPVLALPVDRARPPVKTFAGARQSLSLNKELVDSLRQLSRHENSTLFMVLLAAFQTLLYRYTGQTDIVVGSPIANRTNREIEGLIGFFVNTLVLRARLSGTDNFRQLLKQVREHCLGAYAHQDVPFEKLVEELQPERNLNFTPLFQVMMVLQDGERFKLALPGLTIDQIPVETGTTKFDLTLSLVDSETEVTGWLEYSTDLFEAATIKRMVQHLTTLLEGIAAGPEQRISELRLLSVAEREQLLTEWNETQREFAGEKCLHEGFEKQVEKTPDAIAVVFEQEQLSYRELNSRANQLAHYLVRLGVGPETVVGICMERSLELMVAVLGVLKAGGGYFPLDPASPRQRLSFMLADSQAPVVLTQERLLSRLPEYAGTVVSLDSEWPAIACESEENFESGVRVENVAYVIYTSGSTGKPKGVVVEQRQILNYIHAISERVRFEHGASYAMVQPLTVDAAQTVLFPPLYAGGTVHLISPERATDAAAMNEYFAEHAIDCLKIAPSHLEALHQTSKRLMPLRSLVLGGESPRREWIEELRRTAPDCDIVNHYGPTETTVAMLTYGVNGSSESFAGVMPLGRPLANTRAYVLDKELQPVPLGVAGELFIGGECVTRGYLGQPEKTAQQFIPDPFSAEPGVRLYMTGDMVRYEPDGNLIFVGRKDEQMKIRGYRVEPAEIEAAVLEHEAVRECIAMLREDVAGDPRLVAYCVCGEEAQPSVSDLRSFLAERLPVHMLPSAFVLLESLPLTAHGKVDRKNLPAPDQARSTTAEFAAPRTSVETQLAAIWEEVLGVERVSINDNFFELGGHSLLATRLTARIREAFAVDVSLRRLFEEPTIARLGVAIEESLVTGRRRTPTRIKIQPRASVDLFTTIDPFANQETEECLATQSY
jgi:amino acid adenylation domain-containing protein